ncbi:MAG TPA: dual specificity protein phosphatase [bacterium]|nr:dual specificity protein phosphatase [bacterium]
MEIFEILEGRLYQSGAPQEAAEWGSIHARGIDVVVDLFGTLDPGVPTAPNSILYIFWPIEDIDFLPALGILHTLVDTVVRLIQLGHKVLVHCHMGKSRSGLLNALVAMKILGITGSDAVELVRGRRPGALGNAVFTAYLRSLPAPAAPGPAPSSAAGTP